MYIIVVKSVYQLMNYSFDESASARLSFGSIINIRIVAWSA